MAEQGQGGSHGHAQGTEQKAAGDGRAGQATVGQQMIEALRQPIDAGHALFQTADPSVDPFQQQLQLAPDRAHAGEDLVAGGDAPAVLTPSIALLGLYGGMLLFYYATCNFLSDF